MNCKKMRERSLIKETHPYSLKKPPQKVEVQYVISKMVTNSMRLMLRINTYRLFYPLGGLL
jgi:hypothetical protein